MPRHSGHKTGPAGVKQVKTTPKMPTTTNNRRAYIRRSLIIPWSSQRRSYEASTAPLRDRWGGLGRIARGATHSVRIGQNLLATPEGMRPAAEHLKNEAQDD